jgi:S1-C subfamily serine protease
VVGKDILSADDWPVHQGNKLGIHGVIVSNLIVDGPAAKAGLHMGDLIMGMDSIEISDLNRLQQALYKKGTSDTARLKVFRRGQGVKHFNVTLEATPEARDLPQERDLF